MSERRLGPTLALALAVTTLGAVVIRCAPEGFTFADADASVVGDGGNLDVNTAQCEGGLQAVADDQAVWVSGSSGDDSTSCTRAAPCKTISAALAKAQSANVHVVYLDSSTFAEALALGPGSAGLTIQGGWSSAGGWTPNCDDTLTRIEAPDDAGSAAVDIEDASNVTLRLLTIESKPMGGVGESLYAVRVRASDGVVLDNVALFAASGGSGAQGAAGSSDGGCSAWPANGTGGAGDAGTAGALAVPGQDGFVLSSGGVGAIGDQGPNSQGGSGTCASCVTGVVNNCTCTYGTSCGASGNPGCSGNGGGGGGGGQGGGVSVALYISDSSVTAKGGSLHAGPGGQGGSGGGGGAAGAGLPGSKGATSSCTASCVAGTCYNNCFCYSGSNAIGGGSGGDAGPGGAGGQGGGGAGGSVFLWASSGGSSVVNIDPSTLAASSFVGSGGAGGQPNGVSGLQADHP
jgi:hypothetical protein